MKEVKMNSNYLQEKTFEVNDRFIEIKDLVINSRNRIYTTVNVEMLMLYWNIGKIILEIQNDEEKASYGSCVIDNLSKLLVEEFGRGFSVFYGFLCYMATQVFVLIIMFILGLFNKDIMNLFFTNEIVNIDMIKFIIYLAIFIYTITLIVCYIINVKLFNKGVNVD